MAKAEIVAPLTYEEKKEFSGIVAQIHRWIKDGFEVGKQLEKIRDRRLYLAKYCTFDAFTKTEFGFTKSRANQLIAASAVVTTLTTRVVTPVHDVQPTNEKQVRDLTTLTPIVQKKSWDKAVEIAGGEQPTAKQVQEAVKVVSKEIIEEEDSILDTPEETQAKLDAKKRAEDQKTKAENKKVAAAQAKGLVDSAGHLVPSFLIEVFTNAENWKKHRDKIRDLGRLIASLARRTGGECCASIETLVEVKRDNHGQVEHAVCHSMNNIANDIEAGCPYSVCPSCKGANAMDNSNL